MKSKIYLMQNDELHALVEEPYESEDLLQELLEKYPDLLAGDQINQTEPRKWLLVTREMGIPGEMDGYDVWSLDHLFLDQDGVPTLVEVKRSTDTRIRREVVGQMLDYAANATVYWPVESIRAIYESTCEKTGNDPNQQIIELLGTGKHADDIEAFWKQVKTNLQAARIRLVFLADAIPPELRRIVEFLNSVTDPTEVLAVELKQYMGDGVKTLVPRVIGQSAEAQQKKGSRSVSTRRWDEKSFLEDLENRNGKEARSVVIRIIDWSRQKGLREWWGQGAKDGSFVPMFDFAGERYFLFSIWTYGRIEISFQYMKNKPPFDDKSRRLEILRRLNEIEGVSIPEDRIGVRPPIGINLLTPEASLNRFLEILDWVIGEIIGQQAVNQA